MEYMLISKKNILRKFTLVKCKAIIPRAPSTLPVHGRFDRLVCRNLTEHILEGCLQWHCPLFHRLTQGTNEQ